MKGLAAAVVLVGLAVLGLIGKGRYDAALRDEGARGVVEQQIVPRRDSIRDLLTALASAYRVDTVVLRQTIQQRKPIADTVTRWLTDTVPVPVEVVREIVRADSLVIQACTVALNTCEQEKAVLRRDIVLADSLIGLWRQKAQPAFTVRVVNYGKTIGTWELLKAAVRALTK